MSSFPLPIAAFLAGLISFLSPCVLPLVPGYVLLVSGIGVEELKSQGQLLGRVMLNSVMFILVFSLLSITLGAISTEVFNLFALYKWFLRHVSAVVVFFSRLHLT